VFFSATAHELAHVKVARRYARADSVLVVQLLGGSYIAEVKPRTAGEELRDLAIAGSALSFALAVAFRCRRMPSAFGAGRHGQRPAVAAGGRRS